VVAVLVSVLHRFPKGMYAWPVNLLNHIVPRISRYQKTLDFFALHSVEVSHGVPLRG
jgi:hypothetical protein